ncbi:MAG: CbiX/SirB N-terminal domain-containing protein, partial [Planctomycetota bacterium]
NADERVLLVVGRGSGDHAAQAELREFARLSGELCGERHVRTCFLAMARPSLDERMAELELSRYRRIVVQPHILFQGDLLERVQTRIRVAAESDRQRTWYLAEHLGPEDELLDTILARGAEVLTGLLPGLLPATTTYL